MRTHVVIMSLLLAFSVAGCATVKRSSIAFQKDSGGSLSVWNADMSAAVTYPQGQMCMQRALAVKTVEAELTTKVSEAIIALSDVAKNAASTGQNAELASLVASIRQTAALLTTTTERTAFLDLGMFYVCQISANGSLTDHQTAEVLRSLTLVASSLGQAGPPSAVVDLLREGMPPGENVATPR